MGGVAVWHLRPRQPAHLVAGWRGWHLYETAPGHYDATDGRRHCAIDGPLEGALVRFCDRVKGAREAEGVGAS